MDADEFVNIKNLTDVDSYPLFQNEKAGFSPISNHIANQR